MSATTEKLLTEIQLLQLQLHEARSLNDAARVNQIEIRLVEANKRLTEANQVLSESTTVLKG